MQENTVTKEKAQAFDEAICSYFMNQKTDEELMEITTQPCWESMRLNKKRLTKQGICMDLSLTENSHLNEIYNQGDAESEDGHSIIGVYTRAAKTRRTFFKDNKKIFTRKDKEKRITTFLRAKGNGEIVACPNCGHEGTITSYIDGCDYCNAKFTVRDFAPKVSGVFIEEDTSGKTRSTFWKVMLILGIITFILIMAGVLSLTVIFFGTMTQTALRGTTNSIITFLLVEGLYPIFKTDLWISALIFGVIGVFLYLRKTGFIVNADIVTGRIKDFSVGDFSQNLDYMLKYIHYADDVASIQPFATCDMSEVIKDYDNITDCSMTKLRFFSLVEYEDYYEIHAQAVMRISRFSGKKIKDSGERINLILHGKKQVVHKNVSALREYKCPSCGGSISLLDGGVCGYCNTKLNMEDYGFVIHEYTARRDIFHAYKIIKWLLVVIYICIFGISASVFMRDTGSQFEEMFQYTEVFDPVNSFYDKIVLPADVCEGVTLISSDIGYVNRKYVYSSSNPMLDAAMYAQYLADNEEYENHGNSADSFVMCKMVTIDGYDTEHQITITYDDQTVHVYEEFSDD